VPAFPPAAADANPRSLLGRIAKYGVSPLRDAREDRLTEIWAAVLDSCHCAGFARHVTLDWLGSAAADGPVAQRDRFRALADVLQQDGPWRCRVETQVPATLDEERRRPDLELTFTGPASVSIWVEVKHGTEPHNRQLFAYRRIQADRGLANAAVLLVAPRNDFASFDPAELPPEVPRLSWERTAESIRTFGPDSGDPVRRFLLGELWSYMREEQLTDPPRLTPTHIAALENYPDARRALERLCDMAAEHVRNTWGGTGDRGVYPQRGEPRQYWWSHQPDEVGGLLGRDWWWDWKLLMDATDILADGERRPAVFAGVTGAPGAIEGLDDAVRQALSTAGFQLLGMGAANTSQSYVVVHEYLDSRLVGDGELPEQARALAARLDRWFNELRDTLAAT
jgi:hypothetical protein